jgi:MOSC domain-containing protein YiiM
MHGVVEAVSRSGSHTFSKPVAAAIRLVAGLGVEGDAHAGALVKHRSRVRRDPSQPNLRQVHLVHAELHDELAAAGFAVRPGDIGENVTTRGLDLLALPTGTRLRLGRYAVVEVTGLRNPCVQLDAFQDGLMAAVLARAPDGTLIRKAGVMAVVLDGGEVRPGDPVEVILPAEPHHPLVPV